MRKIHQLSFSIYLVGIITITLIAYFEGPKTAGQFFPHFIGAIIPLLLVIAIGALRDLYIATNPPINFRKIKPVGKQK